MNNRIYVGNLSWNATEEDLEGAFASVGTVTEAKLIRDRDTNKSRGFGFVTFSDDASAQRAIDELNETDMMGRKIRVSIAEQKQRTGGGDRGGGGGRRFDTGNRY